MTGTVRCEGCGGAVSADYARVLGDNDGRVHACPGCEDAHGRARQVAGRSPV